MTADKDRIGHTAFILYKGGVKGEEPLDDRSSGEPLQVILGEHAVPKGIEALLYELEVGEEKTIEIEPEMAYGYPRPEGIQWYPRTMIQGGEKLQVDDVIACPNRDDKNAVLPGRVAATTADHVQIDVNHPFAGKTLTYWVKLVDLV